MIKADAYGHGATPCAITLEAAGAKWLGVTTTDEGMPLRSAGVRSRILLMTGFWRGEEEEVVRQNLTATVWEHWHLELLNRQLHLLSSDSRLMTENWRLKPFYPPDSEKFTVTWVSTSTGSPFKM